MAAEHDAFPKTLALIGHELSTPLSVASGYVRMLVREQAGPINERQRKMLEEVERACGRMGHVIEEMRVLRKLLSKEIALSRRPFDLGALVEELASGMHESRDRGDVTIEVRRAGGPFEVLGDRDHMARAIGVLLRASLRERGDPGAIVAELSRAAGSPPAALLLIGDEAVRAALATASDGNFDGWRGGLGLALRVARQVVEAHGGTVWSAPDANRDQGRAGWSAGSALRIPLNG